MQGKIDFLIRNTDCSRTYRLARRLKLAKKHQWCRYCAPNKGCNERSNYSIRNWKRHRKTQWKS